MNKNANLNLIIKSCPKEEARRLRILGLSFREIGKILNISNGSARNYTKDIILSEEQKKDLLSKRRGTIKKDIKIDYKNKDVKIKGRIKLQISKKNTFVDNINELILESILDLIKIQSQNTSQNTCSQN